jgi:hypothetical protein
MVNDEISFIYYLKNYAFTLEDFLRRGKEEFFKGVYCESIKMPDSSKEALNSEIKYVKSIIKSYEQFRKP